ncbi:MAG TPA: hypothetical protein VFH92_06315 [Phenylobacterium sp.]|nr:hypothetical protein [Phenylobacterium sp.]
MDAEAELEGFIARFSDKVAADLRAARARMRTLLPGAIELVYDNYNALAIGYGPTERQKTFICSIAGYPRWVSLFLVGGPDLADPKGLLKGEGGVVRHLVLEPVERLDDPDVIALLNQAVARASVPLDPAQPFRTVIKSVSAKQRARRP